MVRTSAVAVWTVPVGSVTRTVASRFTTAGGWGPPQPIDNGAGNASSAVIAMDANGNATAIFNQTDGTRFNMSANRFTANQGWGAPTLIETSDGDAFVPNVAADSNGNAIAVWHQSAGANSHILSNRFTFGGTWGNAQAIGAPLGNADPKMAVDAAGDVAAVWYGLVNGRRFIFSNRFTPSAGWGVPAQIETHTGGDAILPSIALDRSGNALAVWQQEDDGIRSNAYAARFTVAGGWTTPQALKINTGFTGSGGLHVVTDARGDSLAVWSQQVGSGMFSILADRFE